MNTFPWTKVAIRVLLTQPARASVADGFFRIPNFNLNASFAFVVTSFTAGSAALQLRFGFTEETGTIRGFGIDFPVLAGVDRAFGTQTYSGNASVAPDARGTAPGVLPPVVTMFITNPINTTLTYDVFYSCLGGP